MVCQPFFVLMPGACNGVAVVVASVARSALVGWLVFRGAAPYPALPGVV